MCKMLVGKSRGTLHAIPQPDARQLAGSKQVFAALTLHDPAAVVRTQQCFVFMTQLRSSNRRFGQAFLIGVGCGWRLDVCSVLCRS